MVRVGTVSLPGKFNFGNRLQTFALQESLCGFGSVDVASLRFETDVVDALSVAYRKLSSLEERASMFADRTISWASRKPEVASRSFVSQREEAIAAFTHAYIREHVVGALLEKPEDVRDLFDFFVVGSDQVWNPQFTFGDPAFFLRFADPSTRIAYAASIGTDSLPFPLRKRYARFIAEIPSVSVREDEAALLVRRLTGRVVPVVVDPTLLVSAESWLRLAQAPSALHGRRYAVRFLFGGAPRERLDAFEFYSRRDDLEVVDLYNSSDRDLFCISPLAFVGAIYGASLVITDSFHAALFSILMGRTVLIQPRGSMDGRFDTLRRVTSYPRADWYEVGIDRFVSFVDWDSVEGAIASQRDKSLDYLRSSLVPRGS